MLVRPGIRHQSSTFSLDGAEEVPRSFMGGQRPLWLALTDEKTHHSGPGGQACAHIGLYGPKTPGSWPGRPAGYSSSQ